ncbi:MAG: transcriptional regulator [Thermoproteota archaeon]|nr:transcriptional regulator [Thermoproteota archaeon]
MKREKMLDTAESIFEKAGFHISRRCCSRPSCFDLAARMENQLVFLKAHVNIGSVSAEDASELKSISKWFSAASIFLGVKARGNPLEDDTVYSRYDVYTITPKTMEDIVLRRKPPLVEAAPGGYYVRLDGDMIRKRRENMKLSVGKMAEKMGVSRRTLYGYEKGITKASVSAAYKLAWILGAPVAQPVDVFQPKSEEDSSFLAAAKRTITKHSCVEKVIEKFKEFRLKIARVKKAPFDFIAQFPDEQLKVIGGVVDEKEKNVDERAEEILSVSEVVGAQAVFITDGEKTPNNRIPVIRREDLARVEHLKDFIAKI